MTTTVNTNQVADKKVIFISSKAAYEKVLDEAANKIVLLEFYAQWCGPCKLIGTKLEEWANLYNDKAIIVRIDVDDYEDIAIEHNVTSMPTFVFMKNKKKLDQFAGSNSEKVEEMLVKLCGVKLDGGNPFNAAAAAVPSAPKPLQPAAAPKQN